MTDGPHKIYEFEGDWYVDGAGALGFPLCMNTREGAERFRAMAALQVAQCREGA